MNIKITYNWLREYLDTKATPAQLQKYLSLCGPSVERMEKVDDDFVLDIEVTSNRVDTASVLGVAQEAQAILPQFGIVADIKNNPREHFSLSSLKADKKSPLNVSLVDPALCPRFTAVVLLNVQIDQSPEFMRRRLEGCGIKSINNVVDFSNYLMLSLGQPTHVFDYDKIQGAKMILRESKKGEKITTLDKKEVLLPGGDIVIEDGSGKLIDLCGVMGGLTSAVTGESKNVLLFVQTYEKNHIRRTSMTTGIRTVAATYFEKGLDEERVSVAAAYGVSLFQKYAGSPSVANITDIYPQPYKKKTVTIDLADIDKKIGVRIKPATSQAILTRLGFGVTVDGRSMSIGVPSWRKDDIEIKEDVIEEIARIYGYYNLPNNLQSVVYLKQPVELADFFTISRKIKFYLKHLGIHETMNYSMVSKSLIEGVGLKPETHLKLKNTISEEIRYLRRSLSPSLLKNVKDNEGKAYELHFFEIAKVYQPTRKDLPREEYKLGIITNGDFYYLKGIVEGMFRELNIIGVFEKSSSCRFCPDNGQAAIFIHGKEIGFLGKVKSSCQNAFEIKQPVCVAELDVASLVSEANLLPAYKAVNPYAQIKLDLTMDTDKTFEEMRLTAYRGSKYLSQADFVGLFGKKKKTLRFYFAAADRNLTQAEAAAELEKIKSALNK
ncbi:phenylalanine--tRNA ligase subunit beta [Candidatus Roizmanbacteria bacterium]|nr:phenylalanine--tRNA ligase subunit beta [Candidatus Roizmanbacteria bacterium]